MAAMAKLAGQCSGSIHAIDNPSWQSQSIRWLGIHAANPAVREGTSPASLDIPGVPGGAVAVWIGWSGPNRGGLVSAVERSHQISSVPKFLNPARWSRALAEKYDCMIASEDAWSSLKPAGRYFVFCPCRLLLRRKCEV